MFSEIQLTYARKPLRVLVSGAGAWFAAHDIFAAHRLHTNRSALSHFDPAHLKLETFSSDAGPVRLTAVSPLGVATIAKLFSHLPARLLDGWVRRIPRELATAHGFEPLGWSLLADGMLPAKPKAYTEAADAWKALRAQHPHPVRRPSNIHAPELFDEDPSIRRHDPQATADAFAALIAAGERSAKEDPDLLKRIRAKSAARR